MEQPERNLTYLKFAAWLCYIISLAEAVFFMYLKVPLLSPAGILFLVGFFSTLMLGFGLSAFAKRKSN